jgi:hypothetical protein
MTREQISQLALEAGFPQRLIEIASDIEMQRLALLVMNERERCACICEDHHMSDGDWCARRIRESK